MRIVLDTSAILSLAMGGILEIVVNQKDCCIPLRVEEELKGLATNNDFLGKVARYSLEFVKKRDSCF